MTATNKTVSTTEASVPKRLIGVSWTRKTSRASVARMSTRPLNKDTTPDHAGFTDESVLTGHMVVNGMVVTNVPVSTLKSQFTDITYSFSESMTIAWRNQTIEFRPRSPYQIDAELLTYLTGLKAPIYKV